MNQALIGTWWVRNEAGKPEFGNGIAVSQIGGDSPPVTFKFIKPVAFGPKVKERVHSHTLDNKNVSLSDKVKVLLRFAAIVN